MDVEKTYIKLKNSSEGCGDLPTADLPGFEPGT
ncbi:hypothetical protein DFR87_10085 [Metallosphaera hakonensis JCM 8857 = DSM 7519]|uniref:ORF D-335-like domain-containing protein n=1 Tax=Metallosphaera hakonensis JCM 8857 = DSM 7519 TaxID=1293036 RepID=A0A2U9IX56_9CREN|nr:hypothetical protein DFR87_10085 [Metallosphaera hakonensis JCM 8857 = DSM 7519]